MRDPDGSRNDIGVYGGPRPSERLPRPPGTTSVFEELFGTPEILRTSLSVWGLPGLIHVPTATMVPPGSLDVAYNTARDPNVFPGVDQQKNFNFAFGFLPRVTIGGRGTVANSCPGPAPLGTILPVTFRRRAIPATQDKLVARGGGRFTGVGNLLSLRLRGAEQKSVWALPRHVWCWHRA